jgi:peptidyl-tRNA hydrolase, PTH1 family
MAAEFMDTVSLQPLRFVIVGLGNPGRQYAQTRHNVGFQIVDRLAEKHGLKFSKMMNKAMVAIGMINDAKVIIVKPQTFMNDSGTSVAPIAKYYKTPPIGLLVIYDDLDLPIAQLRMRKFGGSGGHNGMKSIILHTGSDSFPRLRVGIGRPPGRMDPVDYVLEPFRGDDGILMEQTYTRAVIGIEHWLTDDIERVMNLLNVGEDRKKTNVNGTPNKNVPD